MMLVIWRDPPHVDDTEQRVDDVTALDTLLDRLHQEAVSVAMPNAVIIYAGNHYPQRAHGKDDRWVPDDPGDGPLPELFLVVGTDDSPLYWNAPGQTEHENIGPRPVSQPEPQYYFEYFHGGQTPGSRWTDPALATLADGYHVTVRSAR
jgi:hypothetical protein